MSKLFSPLCQLGLLLTLSACASSIDQVVLQKPIPDQLPTVDIQEGFTPVNASALESEQWWKLLAFPGLHDVIARALALNSDIRLVEQRLNEVAALYGITSASRWPSVAAYFDQNRNRATQAGNFPPFGRVVSSISQTGLSTSWEVDLWGRLAASEQAQAARLLSEQYNYEAVRLTVSTTAASLYVNQRVQYLLLQLAESALQTHEELLLLAQKRSEVGLSNDLELGQARARYLQAVAQLPDLKERAIQAQNALTVFLGGQVVELTAMNLEELVATPVQFLPENAPSELLLRRPDVVAAGQQVVAAQGDLNAANKALLPRISLTASYGRESAELSDLFTAPARVWNIAGSVLQPIFQAGRLLHERDLTLAQHNQAVIAYEQVIAQAFAEVHNALVSQREAVIRLKATADQVQNQVGLAQLVDQRLLAGVSPQQDVLNARLAVFSAQQEWVSAWAQQQTSLLNSVKAIGGGFYVEEKSFLNLNP